MHHVCDVGDADAVEAAVAAANEQFPSLDTLVNNCATQQATADDGTTGANSVLTHELAVESWHRLIDVNLTAAFLFSKHCLRTAFLPQQRGTIVHIGSVQGLQSQNGVVAYSASKGALMAMTRTMAVNDKL